METKTLTYLVQLQKQNQQPFTYITESSDDLIKFINLNGDAVIIVRTVENLPL